MWRAVIDDPPAGIKAHRTIAGPGDGYYHMAARQEGMVHEKSKYVPTLYHCRLLSLTNDAGAGEEEDCVGATAAALIVQTRAQTQRIGERPRARRALRSAPPCCGSGTALNGALAGGLQLPLRPCRWLMRSTRPQLRLIPLRLQTRSRMPQPPRKPRRLLMRLPCCSAPTSPRCQSRPPRSLC